MTTTELQAAEVEWYRRNGKYLRERIVRDSDGHPYVIGDWSWNRNPNNPYETIEPQMRQSNG